MTIDNEHFAPGISQSPSTFEDVWRRLPRLGRIALWLVAIALVFQICASLLSGITGSAHPVTGQGSSLDTTTSGTAAFARLLTLNGHHVDRLTANLSPTSDRSVDILFSLGATTWNAANTKAVEELLARGDTVTLSGEAASMAVLHRVAPGSNVEWNSSSADTVTSFAVSPLTNGVKEVNSPGPGTFLVSHAGSGLVTLASGSGGVLALEFHDRGQLIVLASSSPLWNRNLATGDDAAFGLNLGGPSHSVVAFDEYAHGVGVPERAWRHFPVRGALGW